MKNESTRVSINPAADEEILFRGSKVSIDPAADEEILFRGSIYKRDSFVRSFQGDNDDNYGVNSEESLMSEKKFEQQYSNDLRVSYNLLTMFIASHLIIIILSVLLIVAFKRLFVIYNPNNSENYIAIALLEINTNIDNSFSSYKLWCSDNEICSSCNFDLERLYDLFEIKCNNLFHFKISGIIVSI